jgi:hypothetical protein
MKGSVDACFELSATKSEFIKNIKSVTGLTDIGIANNKYIQELISRYNQRQ